MPQRKVKTVNGLTLDQVEELKQRLVDERNNLIFKGIKESDEFNLNNEDRSDEVDQANADHLNSQRLRFRNREVFYEKKVVQALERIADGSYAECTDCGAHITYARLRARPTAELCINCKEESERDESNNFIQRQSKSQGKAINLVRNL